MSDLLLIRADCSTLIGLGHADAVHGASARLAGLERGRHIAMSIEAPAMKARLQGAGIIVHSIRAQPGSTADAEQAAALAPQEGAPWVL
jgi:hypothetical protein